MAQPRFIPLFEEKSLDSLLQTAGDRRADYVNQLYTLAERGAKPLGKPQKHCTNCSGNHWKHTLQGVNTVYFSPSGLLHRLNLAAIPIGLGDIQGNEGGYGLQRAFKIAGAKYLIMSLWQVDDQATMKFMEVFYRKWLEGKMPIPDAFRATQAEMRERFLNPYLWAGFVLVE